MKKIIKLIKEIKKDNVLLFRREVFKVGFTKNQQNIGMIKVKEKSSECFRTFEGTKSCLYYKYEVISQESENKKIKQVSLKLFKLLCSS